MLEGKIIKGISGFYYVDTEKGLYECKARGIFRKQKVTPLVGDRVKISVVDEDEKKGIVEEIDSRDTELIRPPIANVDKALIVFAIKNPKPNLSLLDRFIVLAEKENLETVIILTKADLDDDNILEHVKKIYELSGYKVIPVSNVTKLNIDKVKDELKENVVVFAGPSGVGKSSLLNEIDENFQLQTGVVSDKIKRGKHTTRHAELLKLEFGGMVADTPGFSSLALEDIEEVELKDYFIEFDKFNDCKFGSKCIHENEPNCAIKEAVANGEISKERYDSYIQLLNEIRQNNSRRY
ncbi:MULTISPECIES: ribosome small subunit-dependent GTPase A [unclassified Clostridioides]|uniref:ribosome small subunit-dependent GTPase A n=1 Tax=unclassified Clostridioides TaxID=2635829 RepID=UPI001D0C732F|nr:ribosome small subunit-dependent GTPase A [Clostridioides sp. ES-S-0001-02]MCC0639280.1 ribosome small subunit-dependent GTPase A [Clostridioides sp. ES-S-0049-03]MCC0653021.1 ribosome small subunit-dependent GTPase A [Clostridioides sp. ES-S-0001-03]MCC0656995.1 ribosome small subunit-dependent GTPase A [Clostridioides sp. ES-S-0123-01]MCC0672405.1 ribosome small subunit-dependent GTPase A [Clostridioides sp. ES-S-0145-01]MCC0675670.1 ribosome small subunit-dependent GTPase A [Clostridioid